MSRPFPPRSSHSSSSFFRVNGKIRAREVRLISTDGKQLGILSIGEALTLARNQGVDLVEIAPTATPPVCRLVDYGKFRYEQSKKDKESKKHQHANKVKEVQLSPNIDPHDFGVKQTHAIDFLCEDMKVKITLRFRGREMAHTEIGFQVVNKLIQNLAPYGHPDSIPKLIGRGINVMVSPLPRNKRAKNPNEHSSVTAADREAHGSGPDEEEEAHEPAPPTSKVVVKKPKRTGINEAEREFSNSPFEDLDAEAPKPEEPGANETSTQQ